MSRQADAKDRQKYIEKVIPRTCTNCAHLKSVFELPAWAQAENEHRKANSLKQLYGFALTQEKMLRCAVGNFKVKKMASCQLWKEGDPS